MFEKKGYTTIDYLRPLLWGNPNIAYYYAQNILLFIKDSVLENRQNLKPYITAAEDGRLAMIHPVKWLESNNPRRQSLKRLLTALPFAVGNTISTRFNGNGEKQ
jgi:hypothetical protein